MKRPLQALTGLAALTAAMLWLGVDGGRQEAGKQAGKGKASSGLKAQKIGLVGGSEDRRDPLAGAQVMESRETTTKDAEGRTVVRRLRLVRVESMKYPLLRVEEDLLRTPQGDQRLRQATMVGDHVLVKLRQPQTSEADFLQKLGDGAASVRRRMPASGIWLVAFSDPTLDTVPRAVARLGRLGDLVQTVEPDHILSVQAAPSDPSFSQLWGMHNTGQDGGVADADIDAPEAWDLHTGSRSVLVAVIDSGIMAAHPDLAANLWTNPGEIPGNGIDDDGNGYVDDVSGWDYVNWDNDPADDHGHGTHCAGTIGAVGNNATGVSGVCWQVSLLALKFLNSSGNGYTSDAAEAILYAMAAGARVTSNSYTGSSWSELLKSALDTAGQAGVLCVAAAGNTGADADIFPEYPAAYDSPNLISVAATTRADVLADYSNRGAVSVDLAAPGSDILSTTNNGGYGLSSGTSMAAPHVAGACALLMGHRPAFSHTQVRELLLRTVDAKATLAGKCATGGRLNLYNAMLAADDILATPTGTLTAAGPVGGPFTPTLHTLSLTNHGTSTRPWTAACDRPWITLSPASGSLPPGGTVEVSVQINAAANPLLATTHQATLSVTSTSSGRVQTRALALEVSAAPVFTTRLDTDPGWPRNGEWAYGAPLGQGGQPFGSPDPASGATGTSVFGIQLAGNYAVAAGGPHYLTAGPFNLTGHHASRLRYQRWLNVDYQPWVVAAVEVSTNGSTWTTVWQNNLTGPRDSAWMAVEHDLSALADGQASLYVRWVHQVTSTDAYAYSGWNLDDIEIQAVPDRQTLLQLPASLTEGGLPGTATIMVAPAPDSALTLTLTSSRPGEELAHPTTITLPAGKTEAAFTITPLDDARIDGSQPVSLTASAAGWPASTAAMVVHDNENGTLALALPGALQEGQASPAETARLTLAHAAPVPIEVMLASSRPDKLLVPATVTIPQGQQEVFFSLQAVENDLIDGDQQVEVTASVTHWAAASGMMAVTDNESRAVALQLPTAMLEGAGIVSGGGRVQLQGRTVEAVAFTLSPDAVERLAFPPTVTVPAGESHAVFDLAAPDDDLPNGAVSVSLSATASGFLTGHAVLMVNDDELPALPSQPAPADGLNPASPESDLVWSYDPLSGGAPDHYDLWFGDQAGGLQLIGSQSGESFILPRLEPATTYLWRVTSRRGPHSQEGPVWSFTTAPVGNLHHFAWDGLPPAAARAAPLPVRVTACDSWGNVVAGFSGAAALTAAAEPVATTSGTGGMNWFYPFASYYHDARMQSIYTPAEAGGAGTLTALSLDITRLPGQALKDLTIRLKHTTRGSYPSAERTWESAGWTTVFSETRGLSSLGWQTFVFSTPFVYDGQQNLMVDISFNNNSYSSDGGVRSSFTSLPRSLCQRVDSTHGAPTAWSGTSPQGVSANMLPNLRLHRAETPLPMTPEAPVVFTAGAWSGSLSVLQSAPGVSLQTALVADPAITGRSSKLEIVSINDVALLAEPLFTGGTSNTLAWNDLGTGYTYEIERGQDGLFSQAESSGPLTSTQLQFTSLEDGRTYHYRVRASAAGLTGQWSAPERSTQDASAPAITFTPGSGGVTLGSQLTLVGGGADLSGISSLAMNGAGVSTANAFASWSLPITGLAEGVNTFTITATDQAVPPNSTTETWSILRIAEPAADADGNGVGQLMEYAFHLEGTAAHGHLPHSTLVDDAASGQKRLQMTFRRLVSNPSGVQYLVETSADLQSWQNVSAEAEVVSVSPEADGVAEVVTLRLPPREGAQFARVRIRVP